MNPWVSGLMFEGKNAYDVFCYKCKDMKYQVFCTRVESCVSMGTVYKKMQYSGMGGCICNL